MKKAVIRACLVLVIAVGAWYAYRWFQQMPRGQGQIATTKVRRGDVVVRSYARGELRAVRSVTLTAPNLFGVVQVTRLAPLGAFAHEKNLIVEFDDSEVNSRLEEKQLELEQIDEQIKKAQADLSVRNNQDQVELLTARFGVRRAELEVKRNELLSAIDAKKNQLSLEEARRRLKQLESDIASRQLQAKAQLAVLQEKKNKSLLEMARERQRLSQVKLLSPMSGLVAIKQNRPNFFFPGMQIPDIREGDQVQPGLPVADVLDLSDLEVVARIGELDRANLHEGQDAVIELDALAGKKLNAHIKSMSGTATANIFSNDPAKKFDVVFALNMRQLLSVLGVKPAQVEQILKTGEQNRKKPALAAPPVAGQAVAAAGPGAVRTLPARGPGATPELVRTIGPAPPGGGTTPVRPVAMMAPNPSGAGANAPGPAMTVLPPPTGPQFTDKELAEAELPPPPEENAQFEALLRPGLLADVEIIVEKIPNAIHIPNQAVFEKDGKLVVYVKQGNRFEPREFKALKRSESTMVIASGLQPGEVIALADPTENKSGKEKKKAGAGAMSGIPGGAGK